MRIAELRKLSAFVAILIVNINCNPADTSDAAKYDFVNFLLTEHTLIEHTHPHLWDTKILLDKEITPWSDRIFLEEVKLDTPLLKKDSLFIIEQIRRGKDFKWRNEYLKSVKIISRDSLNIVRKRDTAFWYHYYGFWTKNFKLDRNPQLVTISMPLFSKDGSYAICRIALYEEYGGGGEIVFFKKLNGSWQYYKQYDYWEGDSY